MRPRGEPSPRALAGRSILVVGINYAPETSGIAPYTTAMCESLARAGASTAIITGLPHYPTWDVPDSYRHGSGNAETLDGVRVHRASHFVPRRQTVAGRGLYEASFLASSTRLARQESADLVIAVTPSLSALRTGLQTARRLDVPFLAVVQDMVGKAASQSGMRGGDLISSAVARSEARYLSAATGIAVIADEFAASLVERGVARERIRLLPNFTHIRSTTATRSDARLQLGWDVDEFILLHTGNMGLKQDLENVLQAARLAGAEDAGARFVLMGDGSQRHGLERAAAQLTNVSIVDPVDDTTYPVALAAADALLVNERPTVVDMSLPSKLTSYFSSGRPVVGAVPEGGATRRQLDLSRGAICCSAGNPTALLSVVRQLRLSPSLASELGAAGRSFAREHLGRGAAEARLLAWVSGWLTPAGPIEAPGPAAEHDQRVPAPRRDSETAAVSR
jgi:colanic acid biosynthesis glycosyl transferase WcaI